MSNLASSVAWVHEMLARVGVAEHARNKLFPVKTDYVTSAQIRLARDRLLSQAAGIPMSELVEHGPTALNRPVTKRVCGTP